MKRFLQCFMIISGVLIIGCEQKKEKIIGERLPVVEYNTSLKVEAEKFDQKINFSAAELNKNWPQAGYAKTHLIPHLSYQGKGNILWRTSVGAGSSSAARLLSSPILQDQKLFTIDTCGYVTAVHEKTGERLWQISILPEDQSEDLIGGGLVYGDNKVFATSPYAEVMALDPKDGKILWRTSVSSPVRASATYADGKLYVLSINNQLEVLNAKDGKKLWSHAGITETAGLLGTSSPAVSKGIVIVAYSSGEIFALNADNGHELWSESLTPTRRPDSLSSLAHILALPIIDHDKVIILGHNQKMAVFNLQNGHRLWERQIGSTKTPAVIDGYIFLLSSHNELICLTRDQGQIVWIRKFPRDKNFSEKIIWTTPLIANNKLYIVKDSGELLAIAKENGKTLSSFQLQTNVTLMPIIVNGIMYILADNGELLAIH